MNLILEKRELAPQACLFVVKAPRIARKARAGQFIILRPDERGERIPLTIADSNPERGTITLVVQEVGKTTARLGRMQKGESILDLVGPLGQPSHLEKFGTVVCLGGGFGIAAIHPIAKALRELGNWVISIIGARKKELLIMEEEMRLASSRLLIATDDGSYGRPGFVTDAFKDLLEEGIQTDYCIAIGPVPMMRAVCKITEPLEIKTVVSLNPIMVDGTGMCGACRVTVGGKTRFACVDGPDFDGHQVNWDELVKRQGIYLEAEKLAMEMFLHPEGACHRRGEGDAH